MKVIARVLILVSTLSFGAAFAEELPNPFFPPDPWKDMPPAAQMFGDQEELPNPFFPPDPWKDMPPAA
jgi:hypothetical protein